jgi:hypothetical protein
MDGATCLTGARKLILIDAGGNMALLSRRRPVAQRWSSSLEQLDLFPERVSIDRIDARRTTGGNSRVKEFLVVRFERDGMPHQVFHDHHGWYCADHGPACRAVDVARQSPAKGRNSKRNQI